MEQLLKAVAVLIGAFIINGLIFVGFDALSKRLARIGTTIYDRLLKALRLPLTLLVFFLAVYLALLQLLLYQDGRAIYDFIFVFIALIGAWLLIDIFDAFVGWLGELKARATGKEETFMPLIKNIGKILILFAILLIALTMLGYEIVPLLAGLGIAGLAVALAAQETLANVFAGFAIVIDKPFKVRDRIKLQTGELGDVVEVGFRSTKIRLLDNSTMVISNTEMARSRVVNYSREGKMAIELPLRVASGSDLEKTAKVLLGTLKDNKDVLEVPEPSVKLSSLGGGLNLLFRFWVKDYKRYMKIVDAVNKKIKEAFEKEGIEILTEKK